MKQVSLRVVTGLVLIAIILTITVAYFAWAATPSSNIWIQPGVYPGAPDYTIWREGSNYFAKDQNGYQPYSGTNASQIIQYCINNLNNGGKILLSGLFHILNTITIFPAADCDNSAIIIEGESIGDTWNGNSDTLLLCDANILMFRVGDPAYSQQIRNIVFRNLGFVGAGEYAEGLSRGQGALAFHYASMVVVENCVFQYIGGNTILFDKVWISNLNTVYFHECGATDKVVVNYTSTSTQNTDGVINNVCFQSSVYGDIYNHDHDLLKISASHFEGNTTHPTAYHIYSMGGISIEQSYLGAGGSSCDFIYLYNCWDANIQANDMEAGGRNAIVAAGSSRYVRISHNRIEEFTNCGILFNASTVGNSTILSNIIFDNDLFGIWLYNTKCTIVGNNIASNHLSWGIYENGTSADYNIIMNCNAFNNTLGGIYTSGTNTKTNLCYNNTSWIS